MTGELPPLNFLKGATGVEVPLKENITGSHMVYHEDRIETNLAFRAPRHFTVIF